MGHCTCPHGHTTIVLAGSVGEGIESLYEYGIISIHSIVNGPMTLEEAFERAPELLSREAEQVMRIFLALEVNLVEEIR